MGWTVWIARIRFHELSFKLCEIKAARSSLASLCSDSSKRPYYALVTKIIVRAVSTMNNSIKRQYPDFFKNKNKTKQNKQTTTKRYKQTNQPKKTTNDGQAKTHHLLWKRQSLKEKTFFSSFKWSAYGKKVWHECLNYLIIGGKVSGGQNVIFFL